MKKIIIKLLNILKMIVFIILLLFVLATLYQKIFPNNPSIFGFRTFSIITDSMSPMLKKGDVILIKEKKSNEYKVNDVITFLGMEDELKDKIVTHQIVAITKENNRRIFYTKGIQNISEDPAIYEKQILGKYIYKFKIFSIIEKILDTKIGFILIIVIPLGLIYLFEIKDIVKDVKKIKKEGE